MNLTKVIENDSFRKEMNVAVLTNGYFYATDAHIAVKIKASDLFPIVEADNKVFDKEDLARIAKCVNSKVEFRKDYYTIKGRKFRYNGTIDPKTRIMYMSEYSVSSHCNEIKFVDIESVMGFENASAERVALNAKFLYNISLAFGSELILDLTHYNRAIKVTPLNKNIDAIGLIMPIMINK